MFFVKRFLFYTMLTTISPIGLFAVIMTVYHSWVFLLLPIVIGLGAAMINVYLFFTNKHHWLRKEAYIRLSCKETSNLYCPDD